jgi:cytochrome P450
VHAEKPLIPSHVPSPLVWDHSLEEFSSELDDPYLAAARLHDGPDIIWVTNAHFGASGWLLTRRALIEEAYLDTTHFSSADAGGMGEILGVTWKLIPLEVDPPIHRTYRRILNPYFTPLAVNALDGVTREACASLIAPFEHRGTCEFITEFAHLFPSYIFLGLMGMPRAMLPQFLTWEAALFRGSDDAARIVAARCILAYVKEFLNEQRSNPRTDLMKGILSAEIDGRPLNEEELLGIGFLLYAGGLDTVASSFGWYMRYLSSDLELQARLRANPQDIPRAVDEFVRAFGVNLSIRTVTEDFEFHDVLMRKGDGVYFPNYVGSRDPRAYENPHVIDIDRRARNNTFATGPHVCIGMHLAKRELRIALEAFLSRFKNIRVRSGETYKYHTRGLWGVDYLPLEWDR